MFEQGFRRLLAAATERLGRSWGAVSHLNSVADTRTTPQYQLYTFPNLAAYQAAASGAKGGRRRRPVRTAGGASSRS